MTALPPLTDFRAADGSRQFAALPQTVMWHELRDHLRDLDGFVVTGFLSDGVTEGWVDCAYRAHAFTVNDQFGEYWFFVDDPRCPDEILQTVVAHCARLLL